MTDEARPIDKPKRGKDVLGEFVKAWNMAGASTEDEKESTIPKPTATLTTATGELHELLDRLESKVAELIDRRGQEVSAANSRLAGLLERLER